MINDLTRIDLSEVSEQNLHVSQFVDSIYYVPLETRSDNLLGNISKLIPLKDKWMIVDDRTHSIFFFTDKGKYLYKISKQGIAPGEYVQMRSVAVDEIGDRLFVMDQNRVLVYNMKGEFKDDFKLNFFCTDFAYVGNDMLACYCDYNVNRKMMNKRGEIPLLVLYDLSSHETYPYCYGSASITQSEVIDYHSLFPSNDGIGVMCTYPFSDVVYEISSDVVSGKYIVDFGKENKERQEKLETLLKEEALSAHDVSEGKKGYPDFWVLHGCMESEDIMYVGYNNYAQGRVGSFLMDKKSNKHIEGFATHGWPIKNDLDKGYALIPMALKGRNFYTVVPPFYFVDKKDEITDTRLHGIIENLTGEENPIIMVSHINLQ